MTMCYDMRFIKRGVKMSYMIDNALMAPLVLLMFLSDGDRLSGDIIESAMNLKLNNEVRITESMPRKAPTSSIKEERRRTGRLIAILVGISLLLLAIYHAWVRRIPVVASLVVPALIMFIYVAWVLYTASRDKHKMLDAEAALNAIASDATENDIHISELTPNNVEISSISNKENSNFNTPEHSINKDWAEISSTFLKREIKSRTEDENRHFIKPIILVNDKPPNDLDQKWIHAVEIVSCNEKLKGFHTKRKFKRRFCRSRRYAAFKRSYSIA